MLDFWRKIGVDKMVVIIIIEIDKVIKQKFKGKTKMKKVFLAGIGAVLVSGLGGAVVNAAGPVVSGVATAQVNENWATVSGVVAVFALIGAIWFVVRENKKEESKDKWFDGSW